MLPPLFASARFDVHSFKVFLSRFRDSTGSFVGLDGRKETFTLLATKPNEAVMGPVLPRLPAESGEADSEAKNQTDSESYAGVSSEKAMNLDVR
jgi:hypothetical protein